MITRYLDFLDESLLMSLNESIIYYSPKLRRILSDISSKISNDMLGIEGTNVTPDMTYLDISKEGGCLSYVQMRKAKEMIDDFYGGNSQFDVVSNIARADEIWDEDIETKEIGLLSKSRNLIRIGRLINQLFPKKYSDKEIEEFVNQLKAFSIKELEKLEIVSGNKIAYWYDRRQYKNDSYGQLANSCMSGYGSFPKIFDIYTKNPEVCRMLILVEGDKLLARALVWKVSGVYLHPRVRGRIKRIKARISNLFSPPPDKCEFEYFMDRVYATNDHDVYKLKKYAEEQGWAMRTHNSFHNITSITYNGTYRFAKMSIGLNPIEYSNFPFVDTFKKYNPIKHTLCNSDNRSIGNYMLTATNGSYE